MAASSVTGVGPGSADKSGQKGSEHLFVGVEKLIGVRVVAAGSTTLSGGAATVILPESTNGTGVVALPGVASDYIVVATDQTANHSVSASAFAVTGYGTNSSAAGFVLTGTSTDVIGWAVIKVNSASVTIDPSTGN